MTQKRTYAEVVKLFTAGTAKGHLHARLTTRLASHVDKEVYLQKRCLQTIILEVQTRSQSGTQTALEILTNLFRSL